MNKYRSHFCNQLNERDSGSAVSISGWIHRKRDHGNLLFIDLRDHYGITQCVIDKSNEDLLIVAEKLRSESVVSISGHVVLRDKETINEGLDTGKIEVVIEKIDILLKQAFGFPSTSEKKTYFEELYTKFNTYTLSETILLENIPSLPDFDI